jgi:hypothetical protein
MAFVRKLKKGGSTYLVEVESYRKDGKVKQRYIRYVGREVEGRAVKQVSSDMISVESVKRSLDVLAVDSIAKELGLDEIENKHLLALVYSNLLEKRSINKLGQWLKHTQIPDVLGIENLSTSKLYESLSELDEEEFGLVNQRMVRLFKNVEDMSEAAVIDVTDTYFEGKKGSQSKRRKGKDGKIRNLTQIGLAVSFQKGFPLFHKQYHGNLNNIQICKDMAYELEKQGYKAIIVDRGMAAPKDLDNLLKLGYTLIAGLRKTPTLEKTYLSKIKREKIYTQKNWLQLTNTSVFTKSFPYKKGTLIIVYNPSLEVIKNEHNFQNNKEQKTHTGYSLIYHNTREPANEVVRKYYDKDIIERAFKQMKGTLNLRPIRVWLQKHVKGHIQICYLSYAILTYMNHKLEKNQTTATQALDNLKNGYIITLKDKTKKHTWNLHVPLEPHQQKILKQLNVVYKN